MNFTRSCFNSKNEFSWSLSRHNLFNQCKKAYYFHYYASWGGWLDEAPPSRKSLYRLKQIKTEKEWLDELILEAMAKAIKKEIEPSIHSIKSYCFRKAYAQLISLQNKEYLEDPKKLSLFSKYYGRESVSDIKERISDRMNNIFEALNCESVISMLNKNYLDIISSNEFVKFSLGEIPIWCKTGFIYHDNDEITINNFRFNDFREDAAWAFSGAIVLIYALKNLLRHNKKLEVAATFVYDKKTLPVYSCMNTRETAEIILSSAKDMVRYLSPDNDANKDNFPKCSDKEKCRTCNFMEACAVET